MARVKRGVTSRARHKKIIKMAAGYRGRSGNCFRSALPRVQKALKYAYRDRRKKKSDFRSLWIQRINAAVRMNADLDPSLVGLTYSRFMNLIKNSGILLNRKALAHMAAHSPAAFKDALMQLVATPSVTAAAG